MARLSVSSNGEAGVAFRLSGWLVLGESTSIVPATVSLYAACDHWGVTQLLVPGTKYQDPPGPAQTQCWSKGHVTAGQAESSS